MTVNPTPPGLSNAFAPVTVSAGSISRLTIQLTNTAGAAMTLTSALIDTLPAGLVVAAAPNLGGTCTLASVVANAGGNTVTYNNGATLPNGGCSIAVDVTAASAGNYTNTLATGALTTTGGNNSSPASATLSVCTNIPQVTNNNDSNAGSLRQAIADGQQHCRSLSGYGERQRPRVRLAARWIWARMRSITRWQRAAAP